MKAAFSVLVCCLVALLSESRALLAESIADKLPEVGEPHLYKICQEELKINLDRPTKDLTPEEQKKRECIPICVLRKRGILNADDDVFNEKIYLKLVPEYERERALKFIDDCKAKVSGNPCKFINCLAEYKF